VAAGTSDVGGLRKYGGVTLVLFDPRPPGEDPLHCGATAGNGIAAAESGHLLAAGRCHAREYQLMLTFRYRHTTHSRHVIQYSVSKTSFMARASSPDSDAHRYVIIRKALDPIFYTL
jgi:hypothetical protein